MDYRPIDRADLEACADVFYAADDDLNTRRGLPKSPRNPVPLIRLFDHIVTGSPHRAWLAERDGAVLGFGIAAQREDMTFLSFLFVRPEVQASGVGRALIERAMAGSEYRAVCVGSMQPIGVALYGRYGMVPRMPLFMFSGRPAGELPRLPAGLDIKPVSAEEVADLDREVTGLARPDDHAAWETWDRMRLGLFRNSDLVGYGYVHPVGRLAPVVVRDPELLLPFIGGLMAQLPDVEKWLLNVPGAATETFVALLKAGMRLESPPVLYCATELRIDHSRYMPATFALP
ncbi:MAG: GNAT family N-acetyltransferase [Chloroflexota bacterium]